MDRITREQMLIAMAVLVAKRSTCLRRQVGAVLSYEGRVLSTGYSGAPSGMRHCDSSNCSPDQPCLRTVHAEANAIAFAAKNGISTKGSVLFCTLSPCLDCAKLIVNSGVVEVAYTELYRRTEGVKLLREAGVKVTDAGPELQKMLAMV